MNGALADDCTPEAYGYQPHHAPPVQPATSPKGTALLALCSSGIGELAQADSASAVSNCNQAGLLSSLGWLALLAGLALLASGALLRYRHGQRRGGSWPDIPPGG